MLLPHFSLSTKYEVLKTTLNVKAMKQFPPTHTVSEYIYILIILHIVLYILFA